MDFAWVEFATAYQAITALIAVKLLVQVGNTTILQLPVVLPFAQATIIKTSTLDLA